MAKDKTGKKFEQLAESIFKKLIKNPSYEKVEHNVTLDGAEGKRQIDVLVSNISFGIKYITIIECRDYKRKLSISSVDGFHSKLLDVKANKGILISRNGFSSKAIAKAKRLGITLCTANETEEDNWDSIIDLPILLEELTLLEFHAQIKHKPREKGRLSKEALMNINGFNLINLINDKWAQHQFKLEGESKLQKLEFSELKSPLTFNYQNETIELTQFEVLGKVRARHYFTSTSKLKGTQILHNLTEGNRTVFIDIDSIRKMDPTLFQITKQNMANFAEFACKIRILPNVNFTLDDVVVGD